MQSTDLDNKITGRRRVVQKSLEYACYSAVTLTAILMIIFFATLGYRGIGAFTQTKIEVDIVEVLKRVQKKRMADEARRREERAGGGIAGIRRPNAIPPESGPNSQGLENLKYYVTNT